MDSTEQDRKRYAADVARGLEHLDSLAESGVLPADSVAVMKNLLFDSAARMIRNEKMLTDANAVLFSDNLGSVASVLVERLSCHQLIDLGAFLHVAGEHLLAQSGEARRPPVVWRGPRPDEMS